VAVRLARRRGCVSVTTTTCAPWSPERERDVVHGTRAFCICAAPTPSTPPRRRRGHSVGTARSRERCAARSRLVAGRADPIIGRPGRAVPRLARAGQQPAPARHAPLPGPRAPARGVGGAATDATRPFRLLLRATRAFCSTATCLTAAAAIGARTLAHQLVTCAPTATASGSATGAADVASCARSYMPGSWQPAPRLRSELPHRHRRQSDCALTATLITRAPRSPLNEAEPLRVCGEPPVGGRWAEVELRGVSGAGSGPAGPPTWGRGGRRTAPACSVSERNALLMDRNRPASSRAAVAIRSNAAATSGRIGLPNWLVVSLAAPGRDADNRLERSGRAGIRPVTHQLRRGPPACPWRSLTPHRAGSTTGPRARKHAAAPGQPTSA
jgi:hypothetical protein